MWSNLENVGQTEQYQNPKNMNEMYNSWDIMYIEIHDISVTNTLMREKTNKKKQESFTKEWNKRNKAKHVDDCKR